MCRTGGLSHESSCRHLGTHNPVRCPPACTDVSFPKGSGRSSMGWVRPGIGTEAHRPTRRREGSHRCCSRANQPKWSGLLNSLNQKSIGFLDRSGCQPEEIFARRAAIRGSPSVVWRTSFGGQRWVGMANQRTIGCLLYTSPSPRDKRQSRMPSSA